MEYLAKILYEQKIDNLWKYTFLNTEILQIDCFYDTKKQDFVPHLPIKLVLSQDNEERHKFLQSFIQVNITQEEFQHLQTLIPLEREWEKGVEKVENEITKRKKKRLTYQEINYFLSKGLSRKDIAEYANVSIWNVNRIISKGKRGVIPSNKKRGRKRKIDGYDLNVLYSYFLSDRETTQRERVDYLFQERNLKVHRSTISRTFKRDDFNDKRATKRYFELNINKTKQFIKDKYQLFSLSYCLAEDEFGVNLGETSRYAYSRKGCRANYLSARAKRFQSYCFPLCSEYKQKSSS